MVVVPNVLVVLNLIIGMHFLGLDLIFHDHALLGELVHPVQGRSWSNDELSKQRNPHARDFVVPQRQSKCCDLVPDGQVAGCVVRVHAQRNGKRVLVDEIAFPCGCFDHQAPMQFFHLTIFSVDVDEILDIVRPRVDSVPSARHPLNHHVWESLPVFTKMQVWGAVDDGSEKFYGARVSLSLRFGPVPRGIPRYHGGVVL